MNENEKRQAELTRLKNHLESQLLQKVPKGKYEELKRKLTECSEQEVS